MRNLVTPLLSIVMTSNRSLAGEPAERKALEWLCNTVDSELISVSSGIEEEHAFKSDGQCRLLHAAANTTRAERKNLGWRAAKGVYVLFADGRNLTPSTVKAVVDSALIAPNRIVVIQSTVQASLAHLFKEKSDSFHQAPTLFNADYAVSRLALEECGGFDCLLEEGEDIDLGIRLWEAGSSFMLAGGQLERHGNPPDVLRHDTFFRLFVRHPYIQFASWYRAYSVAINGQEQELEVALEALGNAEDNGGLEWLMEEDSLLAQAAKGYFHFDHTVGSILHFYKQTSCIQGDHLRAYLELALQQGLATVVKGGRRRFDFHLTSNWLRNHTPFYEDLLQESLTRNYPTVYLKSAKEGSQTSIRYTGRYEIVFEEEYFEKHVIESIANIPLPIVCASQHSVEFIACDPPSLLTHVDPAKQFITKFHLENPVTRAHISYDFRCVVHEVIGMQSTAVETDKPNATLHLSMLHPSFDPHRLACILRQLRDSSLSPIAIANTIYMWVIENTRFGTSDDSALNILESGFGNCVDRTALFIALCRMRGIPARERCGAVLQQQMRPISTEIIAAQTGLGFCPLLHTWAEFYVAEYGWLPVEFLGQSFGRRSMTRCNILAESERNRLHSETENYDAYYFGNLDPHRIHVQRSPSGGSIVPRIRHGATYLHPAEAKLKMRHTLTLQVVETMQSRGGH
jgi:transglutaminase-like putative cysteine protease